MVSMFNSTLSQLSVIVTVNKVYMSITVARYYSFLASR